MAKFKFKTNGDKKKLNIFHCEKAFESGKSFGGTRIEMISNRELSLDGCMGIIEYNDVYIRIKIRDGEITVMGTTLDIPMFDGPVITVKGKIKSVEFGVR